MLIGETDCYYDAIKHALSVVYSSAKIYRIVDYYTLKNLGFVDFPPCVFALDMSWYEYETMLDELMQLEVDAFNTPDGKMPDEQSSAYNRYVKYGWLWDMFFSAKIREIDNDTVVVNDC